MHTVILSPRSEQGGAGAASHFQVGTDQFNALLDSKSLSYDGRLWAYADSDWVSWVSFVETEPVEFAPEDRQEGLPV